MNNILTVICVFQNGCEAQKTFTSKIAHEDTIFFGVFINN